MIIPMPIWIQARETGHSIAEYKYPMFVQYFFTISFFAMILGIVIVLVCFGIDTATDFDVDKVEDVGILLATIGAAAFIISLLAMAFTGTPIK